MVGLTRLGEAAWAVEQVMNRWLEEERAATPDLFTLVAAAREFFQGAVDKSEGRRRRAQTSRRSSRSRRRVKAGEPIGEVTLAAAAADPTPAVPAPVVSAVVADAPVATPPAGTEAAIEFPAIDITAVAPVAAPETVVAPAAPIEIAPATPEPVVARAEPEEGGEAIARRRHAALADALRDLPRRDAEPSRAARRRAARSSPRGVAVTEEFERSAHTLAGIAGTVKFDAMRELAHGLEEMLERFIGKPADAGERALIGEAIDTLGGMLAAAEARTLPQPAGNLVARLKPGTGRLARPRRIAAAVPAPAAGPAPLTRSISRCPGPTRITRRRRRPRASRDQIELGDLDFALPAASVDAAPDGPLAAAPDAPPDDGRSRSISRR